MPREVHEHYTLETPGDLDSGVMTGYTVITRETEWDDETRGRALGLAQYESHLCGCGCGRPIEETAKPDQAYLVHQYTCMADKAIQKVRRQDRAKHEKAPEGWDDGLHYYAQPTDVSDKKKPGVRRRA